MMGFFLCTFVAYRFINAMKYYKQTLYILCGLLLTTVGLLVYLLYLSGVENQEKDKQTAEMLLKDAAVGWASQEFDKLEYHTQQVVINKSSILKKVSNVLLGMNENLIMY